MVQVLARKVDRSLWDEDYPGLEKDEVSAIVVQHKDFQARNNALSFWQFDSEVSDWQKNAVLAIVGGWQKIDALHLAWIPAPDIASMGLEPQPVPGITCFESLKSNHVDVKPLDSQRLSALAICVARSIRTLENVIIITREEVVDILAEGVLHQKLAKIDNIPKELRLAIQARDSSKE